MAACSLFEEDEVCLVTPDKGYIYGLILENSEFLSSDEENDDLPGQIKKGTVRVAWHPDGKETVVQEDKVILVDRSLMPGDVVRRLILNEDSQRGYIKDMSVSCHLHVLGTDKYIYNIDSRDLMPVGDFDPDPGEVTLDSWVGRIEQVNKNVILRFPDGARCVISDSNICAFDDMLEKRGRHTEFCNSCTYPGQELRGSADLLCDVTWLNETPLYNDSIITSKPRMVIHTTVEAIETRSVEVHWLCRGFSKVANPLAKMSPPENMVQGELLKQLKPLDWFSHCSVQIGDKAYYTIKETDVMDTVPPKRKFVPPVVTNLSSEEMNKFSTEKVLKSSQEENKVEAEKPEEKDEESAEKMQTEDSPVVNGAGEDNDEYEDVEDEDSDCGSQASGHSNCGHKKKKHGRKGPHLATKSMKKVKGRRARQKTKLPERIVNIGDTVAVEVCYTFTNASVIWQDGSEEDAIPSPELYPIHHLDELEYFPGDYVIDGKDTSRGNEYGLVISCDHRERTCLIQWMKPYEVGKSNRPVEYGERSEMSVYDIKDHQDYKFRPGHSVIRVGGFEDRAQELHAVGQVFRLDSGSGIQVKWPDGSITSCFPQELYIVNDDPSDYDSEWDSESTDSDLTGTDTSWETENEEELMEEAEETTPVEGENTDKTFFILCAHKKTELDTLLVRAQTALAKLESLFQVLDTNLPNVSTCYHDILRIYKICKDLDKILKSNFFEEEEITELISSVRQEIKCEKSRKLARHLEQMFKSWHQGLSDSCKDEGQGDDEDLEQSTAEDSRSLPGEIERNICVNNELESPTEEELVKNLHNKKSSKKTDEDSNVSNDSGTEVSVSLNSDSHGDKSSAQGEEATGDVAVADAGASGDHSSAKQTASDMESAHNAKELCLKICRRLHVLMAKIQDEVNARWKKCESTQTEPIATQTDVVGTQTSLVTTESIATSTDGTSVDPVGSNSETSKPSPESMDTASQLPVGELKLTQSVNSESAEGTQVTTDPCCDKVTDDTQSVTMAASPDKKEPGFRLSDEVEKSDLANSDAPTQAFQMESEAPPSQKYRPKEHTPTDQKSFMTAVRKELKLLRTSLPDGIIIKGFENRMDLYSVMIIGPAFTPYEDGLFFFDIQLPNDYPHSPPTFHYHSYCNDRLNPNLYEDGKVCVSLLGTWSGKGNEVWTTNSNLLQVLVSIQGLILVGEPYYNEAGYERQRGTQQGLENSRMYNEMAILKLLQSLTRMVKYPPETFQSEARNHLRCHGYRMIQRLETWVTSSSDRETSPATSAQTSSKEASGNPSCDAVNTENSSQDPTITKNKKESPSQPDFPLLPVSKGFRLSLTSHLDQFRKALETLHTDKV